MLYLQFFKKILNEMVTTKELCFELQWWIFKNQKKIFLLPNDCPFLISIDTLEPV